MKKPLVSIITPCYNGEKYISRFLNSVLNQTYEHMELILINDGSNDKTEEVALSYSEAFKEKGISFHYIFQQNKGQAAAVNAGLRIFKGSYLTWPDSDDVLLPDNIYKKVEFLEKNKEYGLVLCQIQAINEETGVKEWRYQRLYPEINNLFYDLIIEHNVCFAPGGYMVRADAFFQVIPGRQIYESRIGQNWQLLLPITYKFKYGYINEILYEYYVRNESHSRQEKIEQEIINKTYRHEETLLHILNEMKIKDYDHLEGVVIEKYIRKRLYIAYDNHNLINMRKEFRDLREMGLVQFKDYFYHFLAKHNMLEKVRGSFVMRVIRHLVRGRRL